MGECVWALKDDCRGWAGWSIEKAVECRGCAGWSIEKAVCAGVCGEKRACGEWPFGDRGWAGMM